MNTMRNSFLVLLTGFLFSVEAQTVELSLSAGYNDQVFYGLTDGAAFSADNMNWDLAFDVSPFGTAIRINDGKGNRLYQYPLGSIADWDIVDTAGLSASWFTFYNSDTSWYSGAFNATAEGFDVGLGLYDPLTHNITGDSIYFIQLLDGSWKKICILNLIDGNYNIRFANIDGSEEVETSIGKADYEDKIFVYYNLSEQQIVDREPAKSSWDITFGSYITELAPSVYYNVTGALINDGVEVARAFPVDDPLTFEDYSGEVFTQAANAIGYDWKVFDMASFTFLITDSTVYFVKDQAGNIWKILFTSFEGSSTGNFSFEKLLLSQPTAIESNATNSIELTIYPNPASDYINILFSAKSTGSIVSIVDLNGRILYSEHGNNASFNNWQVDISDLPAGFYTVVVEQDSQVNQALFSVSH